MKIIREDMRINTRSRSQMIDITRQVGEIVNSSGVNDGDVIVYCPHTTAAITINENADSSVQHDVLLTLEKLIPQNLSGYRHSEGNSDSHCKSSIIGCSEQIMIEDKSLVLGTWQGIYFCEFDGPRSRRIYLQIRGE